MFPVDVKQQCNNNNNRTFFNQEQTHFGNMYFLFKVYFRFCAKISMKDLEAPVAQWVKQWPTDLVVLGLILASGRGLSNCKRGCVAHSFSLSPAHCPDMTEILLEKTKKKKKEKKTSNLSIYA